MNYHKKKYGDHVDESSIILELYQKAINRIDDYFEYRFVSGIDHDNVYRILDELSEEVISVINPPQKKRDQELTSPYGDNNHPLPTMNFKED